MTRFPNAHHVRAAAHVARLLSDRAPVAVSAARLAYVHHPSDGIFSTEDLIRGEGVLVQAGLLSEDDGVLSVSSGADLSLFESADEGCTVVLAALLTTTRPLWLQMSTSTGVLADELMPNPAARALSELIPDASMREGLLLALGRTFSSEDAVRTGDLAERHVVMLAQEELSVRSRGLAGQVRRVSLLSDQLGYDVVAPRFHGGSRRLEVKATRCEGPRVSIFISRNEAEVGRRDANWALVVCRVSPLDSVAILGWLSGGWLAGHLPIDGDGCRWQSAEIEIHLGDLHPGLPPADVESQTGAARSALASDGGSAQTRPLAEDADRPA